MAALTPEAGRRLALLTLVTAGFAALLAMADRAALPRADFVFCNQGEVTSLDPAQASTFYELRVLTGLCEGLTRPDPAGGPALPGVAESWTTSPDGLTWRFTLRTDARWSNGETLTADDMAGSLARVLHPETAAPYAALLDAVEGADTWTRAGPGGTPDRAALGVTVESPHTLALRLTRPLPSLPDVLALPPFAAVHLPSLAAHGPDWVRPEHWIGNGPFVLTARRLNDRIRLERSPTYWGRDEVSLASIEALAASSVTTQLNLFLTGAADWMIKPPPALDQVLLPRPEAHVGPQLGSTFLRFNVTRPALSDRRVRRALAMAVDRESLARDVLGAGRGALRSFVPPTLPGYLPATLPPGDAEAARAWLAEAGHPGGEGLPTLRLLYPDQEAARDLCEALAERWRRTLGVTVRLETQSMSVYVDSCRKLQYDLAWGTWIGDVPDPASFLEIFLSGAPANRTGWADPTYDALVEAARLEADPVRRAARWQAAERHLLDELPMAPLCERLNINLVATRVTGFFDNLLDVHPLRDLGVSEPGP